MYVISNGHNYIMKRKGGRICATCDINLALQFESKGLAICEINKLPAGYKNGHYAPKSMDEIEAASKSPNITAPAAKPNTYAFHIEDSEWLTELKKNLEITDKTMGSLNDLYTKVYGDLTAASDEIADIEHAIEFKTVNAAQGYQLMAELKRARRKRREAKDAKLLLEIVMNTKTREWGDGKLETAIEQLGARQFTPKVRNDLFEKELRYIKMTIHILHECIDSSDFYAEGNIITINKDKEKLSEKMFLLYKDCRDSEGNSVNQDETWCDSCEASVVSESSGNYYRHHWKIDKFEV